MAAPKINLEKILKMPLKKRVSILVGINVAIVAIIGYLLLFPLISEISKLKTDINELNDKLRENRLIAADIPRYIRDKTLMEQQLINALTQLPNDKEIPELVDSISSSGSKSGLNIQLFKPGREAAKGFYAEIPVTMEVEGSFESLYDFADKVSKLPRIVNITDLDVATAGFVNRRPILKAKFLANTFRFIPTQADEKDKDKKGGPAASAPEGEKKK